jgi:phage protein D
MVGTNISIQINGMEVVGLLQMSVSSTNRFSADSYSLSFATGDPPLGNILMWSELAGGSVEISAGLDPEPAFRSLITGTIDNVQVDPILGTAAIEGRDLSASLVDSYRQSDFVNQTASEIVAAIANTHGLGAVVTPTSGNVGRYYGDGYTRLSTGQFSRLRSDWDLVVELARECEFDVFVSGQTLYFVPSATIPLVFIPITPAEVQTMRFERALAIAPGASARVQAWNSQAMTAYDSDAASPSSAGPAGQPYLFSASNLTSDQVGRSAARFTAEINRLRTTLLLEMPWNLTLVPRTGIMLTGTGSLFDGPYVIETVELHFGTTTGSRQTVKAASIPGVI